jgi:putative zinc finger/helix-turn-helix YgiT family protein
LTKVEKCEECGKKMCRTIQNQYRYLESGLSNVVLDRIAVYVCECGEYVVGLPNIQSLHASIFEKIVRKKSPLRGVELRFLRREMEIKSADFAKMLKVHPATLSKWESGDQAISEEHDKLIRFAIVLRVSEIAKQEVAEAHRLVADRYLDLLGQIQATVPSDTENDQTVQINRRDLREPALTFRWGLTASPRVTRGVRAFIRAYTPHAECLAVTGFQKSRQERAAARAPGCDVQLFVYGARSA